MSQDSYKLYTEAGHFGDRGQYQEALASYQQAADGFLARGAVANWIDCLCQMGQLLGLQGRYDEAEWWLRRAAAEAQHLEAPLARCHAFCFLGDVLLTEGRHDEAEWWLRRAAAEAQHLEAPLTRCHAFCSLGEVLRALGRYAEAVEWQQRGAVEADQLKDSIPRSTAFHGLGDVLLTQGRFGEAEQWLRRAAAEADKLPQPLTRCNAFRSLGEVLLTQHQHGEAEYWLRRAAAEAELTDFLTRSFTFRLLGRVLSDQGRSGEAEGWLRRAADEADNIREPVTRCNAFHALGDVLLAEGRHDEAEWWLRRAAAEADTLEDPLTRANVEGSLGTLAMSLNKWECARENLAKAQVHLLQLLSQNRWPEAVGEFMARYSLIFAWGLLACEEARREEPGSSSDRLWQGLEFADTAKCVAIREGLRRHGRSETRKEPTLSWRAAPPDRGGLFAARQAMGQGSHLLAHRAVRGHRDIAGVGSAELVEPILAFPGEIDEAKREFCQPVDRAAVGRLLPDHHTVLVVFFFAHDDLIVLPVRRDGAGEPQLLHRPEGYFRVPGVLPRLRELLDLQEGEDYLGDILNRLKHVPLGVPVTEVVREVDMTPLYTDLYDALRLDDLLLMIEPDPTLHANLHLVLVPDGPLYRLPLHAACKTENGRRLYEQVKSLRYGLSLRTLELQQQIQDKRETEEAKDQVLQGTAFANPDRKRVVIEEGGVSTQVEMVLQGVIDETEILVRETSAESWWLHGEREPPDQQANRANLRERHRAGNIGWTMGHGIDDETARLDGVKDELLLSDGRHVSVAEASLLLCDGLVSMSRMLTEGYDFSNWRLFNISACLVGKLRELGESKEVLGYIAILTLLRCRRVTSALWRISDVAAPEFARHWIRAIKQHVFGSTAPGPHSFALAFKEALDNFRQADDGRFDHEFFWAPYTLYGLG